MSDAMIVSALNNLRAGESSAAAIARYFKWQDINRKDISGEDLKPFYQHMKKTADSAINMDGFGVDYPTSSISNNEDFWGVIVETRQHPSLEFVINQFAQNLNIGIQIFHGSENKDFIENSTIGRLIDKGQVNLTDLGIKGLNNRQYNALLLKTDFWKAVYGKNKILVFQTDAVLCKKSSYRLDDFIEFDYIGSKWNRKRPLGIIVDGGNGGLSLRDHELTLKCLKRFPGSQWPGGEDGYFAFHFDLVDGVVARDRDCVKFSTQIEFSCKSFGGHKLDSLKQTDLQRFLRYCPEARHIIE